jgi:hypothetical protein
VEGWCAWWGVGPDTVGQLALRAGPALAVVPGWGQVQHIPRSPCWAAGRLHRWYARLPSTPLPQT